MKVIRDPVQRCKIIFVSKFDRSERNLIANIMFEGVFRIIFLALSIVRMIFRR